VASFGWVQVVVKGEVKVNYIRELVTKSQVYLADATHIY
jgi:hypothetical protein